MAEEKPIGKITHYYGHLNVGIIKLNGKLAVGSKIRIKGHTTDFEQDVKSMQYDHKDIKEGKKGQEIGIEVTDRVREGDEVFKA